MATVKLTAPNGATVSVAQERVENLLRQGFTETAPKPVKKATAKKASPASKS